MSDLAVGDCGACIGGWDGDPSEVQNQSFPVARKTHKCEECDRVIQKGEKYERVSGKWDGEFNTFIFCAICSEISICLSCEGRCFGNLWEELELRGGSVSRAF